MGMIFTEPLRLVYILCCDFRCEFPLLMYVNEYTIYECSDAGTYTQNINNLFTRSHPSEGENRTINCKCKREFKVPMS
jgi:hypothetical protein